ncbi:MAG: beta-ketoacyl synthase N-terminal-like domain-containing protein [Bacteroidetes bacterium]|jgi:3-oxoacyl-(acyl-carrier-protein) synthase|nr:beta-ketoacyl synthase N-terminal-like domain-containing protein [Bacteroidota bacterium]MDA0929875.1 beta-ketoacyl synthase N-terminal-like domain-containing protein [Bacteroidota bacterium]
MKPIFIQAVEVADGQAIWPEGTPLSPFYWKDGCWRRQGIQLEAYPQSKYPDGIQLLNNMADKLKSVLQAGTTAVFSASSRGDESYLFNQIKEQNPDARSSPFSTHGVYASSMASFLNIPASISASQTCSSSGMAFINAIAWMRAGLIDQAVVAAIELPEHPSTIAMLKKSGILNTNPDSGPWPLRTSNAGIGTVVSSAAVAMVLTTKQPEKGMKISGIGWAMEKASSPAGIHPLGLAFQESMKQACHPFGTPDLILAHLPGTRNGNLAEQSAIDAVFKSQRPITMGSKWFSGHALGASTAVSMVWAWKMLAEQCRPMLTPESALPSLPQSVLINSQGFGGQATSILLENV